MPVRWLSKEFQYPFKENFGATRSTGTTPATPSPPVTGAPASCRPTRRFASASRPTVQVVYDQEVPRNGGAVRLPSGFKSDIWQFEIKARAPVYSMHVASTIKELKGA